MDEPVLSWQGLRLADDGGGLYEIEDLDLLPGRSYLVYHHQPEILKGLASRCAALELQGQGDVHWRTGLNYSDSTSGPVSGRLSERFEARLELFRSLALINSHSQFLSNYTIAQNLCLDLEYNQGLSGPEVGQTARGWLERLDLARWADVDQSLLVGPDRGLALLAWALSRKPMILILDRPLSLMGHQGFSLAWPVVKEELLGGLTVLVLDYVPGGYPQGVFDVVVALGVRFIGDVNGGDDANSLHNG